MEQLHQSLLEPTANKFHVGNLADGKHYWLTPPDLYAKLNAEFGFDFDPCPFPKPDDFDGLTCEWGRSNYVNPPFGSIIHQGKKKGPTAWVRKCITEWQKGKTVVLVYPVDKWVLMLLKAIVGEHGEVRNLGDVRWLATEDGSIGKGTGRHIACFILRARAALCPPAEEKKPHEWSTLRRGFFDVFNDDGTVYATVSNSLEALSYLENGWRVEEQKPGQPVEEGGKS